MGFKFSEIASRRVPFSVTIGDGTLTGFYNAAAFTSRLEMAAKAPDADTSLLARMLSMLIVEWDLVDDEGRFGEPGGPYPTTEEALLDVPLEFLGQVMSGINEAIRPNPTTPATSGSFS